MKRIGIVDYGLGNLFSVQQAMRAVGVETTFVSTPSELASMDGLILPGVGAFGEAMRELKALQLDTALKTWVQSGRPLLGVCLGLQLLMESSEEFGSHQGMGLLPGRVHKFPHEHGGGRLRVPHMGWDAINPVLTNHAALTNIPAGTDMYFVHSYFVEVTRPEAELTYTVYGNLRFTSSVALDNIWAFQFHPEKSGTAGLQIYRNWIEHNFKGVFLGSLSN